MKTLQKFIIALFRAIPSNLNYLFIKTNLITLSLNCGGAVRFALLLGVFWCGATTHIARADDTSAIAVQPVPHPVSTTPSVKDQKPIVLPEFDVNGLRERLDAREKMMEKQGTGYWAGFMRLDNGSFLDNIFFCHQYKSAHPNELVRLVTWMRQGSLTSNPYHYGIGEITDSIMIENILVYTARDELHVRDTRLGDRVYSNFKASQIFTLTDHRLRQAAAQMIIPPPPMGSLRPLVTTYIPDTVAGDDPNLQVRYAEAKLKEVGITAFVVPATDRTGPNNDLMLIFGVDHNFYVWRPYYGAYHLSKDSYAKFGIREVVDAAAK